MTIYVLDSHPLMCQAISFFIRRIDPSKKVIEVHAYSKLQEVLLINGQPETFVIEPLAIGISGTAGIKQIKNNYLSFYPEVQTNPKDTHKKAPYGAKLLISKRKSGGATQSRTGLNGFATYISLNLSI